LKNAGGKDCKKIEARTGKGGLGERGNEALMNKARIVAKKRKHVSRDWRWVLGKNKKVLRMEEHATPANQSASCSKGGRTHAQEIEEKGAAETTEGGGGKKNPERKIKRLHYCRAICIEGEGNSRKGEIYVGTASIEGGGKGLGGRRGREKLS